jgi:KDO2-lipid IV(A) lauroyltransferase
MPSPTKGFVLYASLRSFLAVGGSLPLAVSRPIGKTLSAAAIGLLSRSRKRMWTHLGIAFPEKSEEEREALLRGCARHFGLMLAEVSWLWSAQARDVEALCAFEGREHMDSALEEGRGVMITTAHCGNWELHSASLPIAGIPLMAAARQLDDPRLDRLVMKMRTRFGTAVVPRGPSAAKHLVRMLARKGATGLLIDQDIPSIPGVFVPFFGRPAWTPSGAAMLAIRRRCPVVPGFIHRRPDGTHQTDFHPPLPMPEGGSPEDRVEELTAAATACIERQIRAHPEQWVWMHRRWRTQPETR